MRKLLLAVCALSPLWGHAQTGKGDDPASSFDAFRRSTLADMRAFRERLLDDYDQFLDGVWREYRLFVGEERDPRPKPKQPPVAPVTPQPDPQVKQQPRVPREEPVPERPATPDPAPKPTPAKPQKEYRTFDFYGLSVRVPRLDYAPIAATTIGDFAAAWRQLRDNLRPEQQVLPALSETAAACGLNDWFRYELTQAYVEAELPRATPAARIALTHYLMAHQGYDARLARTAQTPLLLLSCQQTVYSRNFLSFGGATRYYVFTDRLTSSGSGTPDGLIYSCDIPADVKTGRPMDLIIRPLNMPGRNRHFTLQHDGLTLEGEVNTTLIDMVRHYPQMPVPDYARSTLCPSLRQSLVSQLAAQLPTDDSDRLAAVNRLLHFVQSAFDYATDQDFHGYEKPYFLEEILYYPKSDCEDRAIFFAYLVRHVLGVDNCLIHYPGHECTAIVAPAGLHAGTSFTLRGRTYYIADPTYSGADAGQCMPQFLQSQPEVELWY